jgi:hypothetical protein
MHWYYSCSYPPREAIPVFLVCPGTGFGTAVCSHLESLGFAQSKLREGSGAVFHRGLAPAVRPLRALATDVGRNVLI